MRRRSRSIRSARLRYLLAVLVIAWLVGGCGSGPARGPAADAPPRSGVASGPATPGSSPAGVGATPDDVAPSPSPVVARCGAPRLPARTFTLPTPDGERLAAVEAGTGPRGVLLLPEAGPSGLCGWWPYAAYLAGRGFHVLLIDDRCAGDSGCGVSGADDAAAGLTTDAAAGAGTLRRRGADRIAVVGASRGASVALILGTRPPAGVAAVVALSADELTDTLAAAPYPATAAAAARKLRLPGLVAVARDDPNVSVADTTALVASAPEPGPRLIVEPATAGHGWNMLAGAGTATTALGRTIVAFLDRELR